MTPLCALKGYAPEIAAVPLQLVLQFFILRHRIQAGHALDGIQTEAGKTLASLDISAEKTPAASCADKDLQRNAGCGISPAFFGAFDIQFRR